MTEARQLAEMLCAEFTDQELLTLRDDPIGEIPRVVPGVTLQQRRQIAGFDCSVSGSYVQATRSITVQTSLSTRRTKFTALHELGHDQARRHARVAAKFVRRPDNGKRLEEKVADAFAAAILIPEAAVVDVLADREPTADTVVSLFRHEGVAGSREACCVRIAQRMRGNGYVLLCQHDRIQFCAAAGSAMPVRRQTRQAPDHFLVRVAGRGRGTSTRVRLTHHSGVQTPEFAAQAVRDGDFVFALLTDATTLPWGGWRPPPTGEAARPQGAEIWCDACDDSRESWQRCDNGHGTCSTCGWCECNRPPPVREKTCTKCWQTKAAHLFPGGGDTCEEHERH